MDKIKALTDFSPRDIEKFDEMHRILTAYNASLGSKNELPLPEYTDEEMAEYSGYRELLLDMKLGE
ncbi:MAG: hypothetical protein HWD62_13540 [Cyclobacteriaceae bacterium]|nr:MAG: hypothetical protein HWD62_13540 [Cyclobacteriaceae bacterium]